MDVSGHTMIMCVSVIPLWRVAPSVLHVAPPSPTVQSAWAGVSIGTVQPVGRDAASTIEQPTKSVLVYRKFFVDVTAFMEFSINTFF